MKPSVKRFSRRQPCRKADVRSCFVEGSGYKTVQVDAAHALIGINVPRRMIENGQLIKVCTSFADLYELTDIGKEWLRRDLGKVE